MKAVGKYNLFKGLSTVLTVGTPLLTLFVNSRFFVHRADSAISAAGVVALLISAFFLKDKLAENFKFPSPFILAAILLVVILFVESILQPMKEVCFMTLLVTGCDELTFKRIYKRIGLLLPKSSEAYKQFGFIFAKTDNLKGVDNE